VGTSCPRQKFVFGVGSANPDSPRSAAVKDYCLFVVIVAYFSSVSVLKSLITLSAFLVLYTVRLLHAVATFTLNTCHIVEHDKFVTLHMC